MHTKYQDSDPMSLTCPNCQRRMTLDFTTSKVYCKHCGYVRPDEISAIEHKKRELEAKGKPPVVEITYRGEVTLRARSAFESGHDLLHQGDKSGALQKFLLAAELQPDFTDAHLWIARVSDDPRRQQEHIDLALAYDPANGEAVRMKMVLTGRLTPEQAARIRQGEAPQLRTAADPVAAATAQLLCPNCGGHLTINEREARVECRFCGYAAPRPEQAHTVNSDLLTMALLERKAKAVRWNIGKRLVHCEQCGADHTIPAVKLSARCRFCGSTHVVLGDALDSFAQPDGIVPFRLTQEQAREAISQGLEGIGQRFANLFNTNRVARADLEGVYLPFWVFEVMAEVVCTRTEYSMGVRITTETMTETDVMEQVAISAVKSPPPELARRIGGWGLAHCEPYEPRWLAKYPAQLYSIDVDRASLEARGIASKALRRKHERREAAQPAWTLDEFGNRQPAITEVQVRIQNMGFQLLLLPVWIAMLTEVDGDTRLALVNGQTGKVAFGQTVRARRGRGG